MTIKTHDTIVYHVIGSADAPNIHPHAITIAVNGVVKVSATIKKYAESFFTKYNCTMSDTIDDNE